MLHDNPGSNKASTGNVVRLRILSVLALSLGACLVAAVVIFFRARRPLLSPTAPTNAPNEAGTLFSPHRSSTTSSRETPNRDRDHPGEESDNPPSSWPDTSAPMSDGILVMETLGPEQEIPWDEADNPASDGWQTEEFQAQAGKQLRALAKLVTNSQIPIDASVLNDLVTHDFSCQPLLPENLSTVFEDHDVTVGRASHPKDTTEDRNRTHVSF